MPQEKSVLFESMAQEDVSTETQHSSCCSEDGVSTICDNCMKIQIHVWEMGCLAAQGNTNCSASIENFKKDQKKACAEHCTAKEKLSSASTGLKAQFQSFNAIAVTSKVQKKSMEIFKMMKLISK